MEAPLNIRKGTNGPRNNLLLCFGKQRKAKCSTMQMCALRLVRWSCKEGLFYLYKPTMVRFAKRTIMFNDKVINLLNSD